MPSFYLNIRNGTGFILDEEGISVPTLADAEERALQGARSLLSAEICTGQLDLRGRIEIADETGAVCSMVQFNDAIHIQTGPLPSEADEVRL